MKNKTAILYGLGAGLITILYFVTFYTISPRMMLGPVVWWSSIVIYILAMTMAIKKSSTQLGELMGIRPALQVAFLVFIIANLLFYIFFYVLFGTIDPSLVEIQKEMLAANPATADQLKNNDFSVTASSTFFNFLYSLIGGFILSLGIAAIMNPD